MKTIIWPVYMNSNHSRGEGRRLSIEDAVEDPKVREISQVLRKLNIEHSVDHGKAYPGSWWEHSGCVEAERGETSKIEFLRLISKNIKTNRRTSK